MIQGQHDSHKLSPGILCRLILSDSRMTVRRDQRSEDASSHFGNYVVGAKRCVLDELESRKKVQIV